MDISAAISSIPPMLGGDATQDAVGLTVLTTALDVQQEQAAQFIQSMQAPAPAVSILGNLGQNIDISV